MTIGLLIVLLLVLILPFTVKVVEHNLEYFLFIMGLASVIISGLLTPELFAHILTNRFLYMITAAVLAAGFLFKALKNRIKMMMQFLIKIFPFKVLLFLIIIVLGFLSSIITAIIAALLLVEMAQVMPLERKQKVRFIILACFSIGLGAVLTPVGEPLSTIVASKLNTDFWYFVRLLGFYVAPGVIALGLLGACIIKRGGNITGTNGGESEFENWTETDEGGKESYKGVLLRAFKVYVFVFALELLGTGFKPLIDIYIINLDSMFLYWGNMVSAVLDNATLAAAEISPAMSVGQIQSVLMGLLISGGMLIPGNIPNIISASKLKIKSREWAAFGAPVGLIVMLVYFTVIFVFQ